MSVHMSGVGCWVEPGFVLDGAGFMTICRRPAGTGWGCVWWVV